MTLLDFKIMALALPVSHHWLVLQGTPHNLHQSYLSGFSSAFPATHTLLSEKALSPFWAHKPVWISASCTLHVHTNTEPRSSLVQTKSDVATFSTKATQTPRTRSRPSVRWYHKTSYNITNTQKVSRMTMTARRKSAETFWRLLKHLWTAPI